MNPPTYPFEETSFMNGPLVWFMYKLSFEKKDNHLRTLKSLGAIHKGRLLKGVGRWVHQKEIY